MHVHIYIFLILHNIYKYLTRWVTEGYERHTQFYSIQYRNYSFQVTDYMRCYTNIQFFHWQTYIKMLGDLLFIY